MPAYNCYKCKYCQLGYCKSFGFKVFTTSELCYRFVALSESEQQHLEASMKENKALMQELAEK